MALSENQIAVFTLVTKGKWELQQQSRVLWVGEGKKKMGAHERKTCIGLGWGGKTHAFKLCQATVRDEGVGKAAAAAGETDSTSTA